MIPKTGMPRKTRKILPANLFRAVAFQLIDYMGDAPWGVCTGLAKEMMA